MTNTRKRGLTWVLAFVLAVACALVMSTQTSYAATWKVMPDGTGTPSGNMLHLNYDDAKISWSSSYNHKVKSATHSSNGTDEKILCVEIGDDSKSYTFNNLCTLTWSKVAKIGGRNVDVEIDFTKVHFDAKYVSDSYLDSDGYAGFASWHLGSSNDTFWVSASTTTNNVASYRAAKTMTTKIIVTYSDTGETVDMPFYQGISDIDTYNDNFAEGWEGTSGYDSTFYYWSANECTRSGNKISAKSSTSSTTGDDCWLKTGCIAPTNNGSFTCDWDEGNCATELCVYSEYKDLSEPGKTVDVSKAYGGDTVTFNVTQKMGNFYTNTFNYYDSMVFTDVIPEGVEYKSAKMYSGSDDITESAGTLNYDENTRTVTYTFNSSWLSSVSNYTGQTLKLEIQTTAIEPETATKVVNNEATVDISGIERTTSETTTTIYKPFHVNYEYVSGTDGKKLPDAISTESGDYAVSDDDTYYHDDTVVRKDDPATGTTYEVYDKYDNFVGTWTLTEWDKDSEVVDEDDVTFVGTWSFTPAPRIVLVKKLEDNEEYFTEAHADQTFLFSIKGNDSGDEWFKSITFTDEAVSEAREGKTYTDSDGTNFFKSSDGYIYGVCKSIYLPEDDYTVSELSTSRFRENGVTASYYGSGETVNIGSSDSSIVVPLKFSEYREGDAGYEATYAGVIFDNSKTKWQDYSHNDVIINTLK